jgi:glycosyltransferase involved in cell wall biosynthesis
MPVSLSIALPCFNEEKNVETTIRDILAWFTEDGIDGEVIAVNDGSRDGTGEVLARLAKEKSNVKVVTHPTNLGYGCAVRSGLDAGTKEWIAFMDSDGQFKAADFRKLLPFTADYAIITGRRRKRADPFMRRVNAKLFAVLNVLILGIWVRDINCAMKMFRRDIWHKVRPEFATGALFNAETFYRAKLQRIAWKQVFVEHYPRLYGQQTGAKLSVILRMFRDLVRLRLAEKTK